MRMAVAAIYRSNTLSRVRSISLRLVTDHRSLFDEPEEETIRPSRPVRWLIVNLSSRERVIGLDVHCVQQSL